MKFSTHGSVAAIVLATAFGLSLAGPHRAEAAPKPLAAMPGTSDLGVSILSPDPHVTLTGVKPVEISAFYQGSPANQIVALELFIDGAKAATKTLDVPETRGVVSFLINASQITPGRHKVVVRATAADQEVTSALTSFTFGADTPASDLSNALAMPSSPAAISDLAPTLHLVTPSLDGKVQGVVTLHVVANDPSGKPPYVSLFIDKTFKTLRNYAPYEFEWDTTAYANGYHTIEAFGYNDTPNVGHAHALRLFVNNPGGQTGIRHDLLDAPKPAKDSIVKASSVKVSSGKALKPARMAAKKHTLPVTPKANTQVATLLPLRPLSTQEIVRQVAAGAAAVHFGSLDFAGQLSSPFVADKTAVSKPLAAKPTASKPLAASPAQDTVAVVTPVRRPKSLAAKPLTAKPVAAKPVAARPLTVKPLTVETADDADTARQATRMAKSAFRKIASVRLPNADLADPFVAVPHFGPGVSTLTPSVPHVQVHLAPRVQAPAVPHFQVWVPNIQWPVPSVQAHIAPAPKTPALKMQPLRIHLPVGMGSLLRSAGQTSLRFNQTTVTIDRPLAARNSVLFGPLRQIFEQGGGTLTWESRTGTVHAKSATKDILLTVGDTQATVNAKEVTLDGKPYLLMGRTMVPVSFIAAALDADVQFDAATGHLLVTSRK